jgi:hypothetical protein
VTLLACLSPQEVALSESFGRVAAILAVGLTAFGIGLAFRQRSFAWLPFYAALLAFHPAWTVSSLRGDCGDAKRFLSVAISLVFLALLCIHVWRPRISRLRFVVILCVLAWALCAPYYISWLLLHPIMPGDDSFMAHALQTYTFASRDVLRVAVVLTGLSGILWLFHRLHVRHQTI